MKSKILTALYTIMLAGCGTLPHKYEATDISRNANEPFGDPDTVTIYVQDVDTKEEKMLRFVEAKEDSCDFSITIETCSRGDYHLFDIRSLKDKEKGVSISYKNRKIYNKILNNLPASVEARDGRSTKYKALSGMDY